MHIIIVGSGVAGVVFAEKYRSLSKNDEITVITRENGGYYSRPLLSRGFSKEDIEQSIILKTFDTLRATGINVVSGCELTAINRHDKCIYLKEAGQESALYYDKLILALGSSAFIPPPFRAFNSLFFCLNSLDDLKTLRNFRWEIMQKNQPPQWGIIGGGLIGCEVASDLAVAGDKVTLIHAVDRLMERQLVAEDSAQLYQVLQQSGVDVLLNQQVQEFSQHSQKIGVTTDEIRYFDALIVACGFKPRTELAAQAGLGVGRGIKVNAYLQTDDEAIYAVGDVAELPNGKIYAFILPIRSQAHWLARYLAGQEQDGWMPPVFTTKAKVHGFDAIHPYTL